MKSSGTRILIVEGCDSLRKLFCDVLAWLGHAVESTGTQEDASSRLLTGSYSLLVADDSLPGTSGTALVRAARSRGIKIPAVVLTLTERDSNEVPDDLGDVTYVRKPFTLTTFRDAVGMWLGDAESAGAAPVGISTPSSSESLPTGEGFAPLRSANGRMKEVFSLIRKVAVEQLPVLLEGESGTGKELLARAFHVHSPRRDRPFVAINCAAINDYLLESELFGHAAGAFTGALHDKPGVVESAHTGTLLLDEVGEMSPLMQAKLLRLLDQGEFRRVGEVAPRHVDVTLLAATNKGLEALCREGKFRRDLYYRLKVVWVRVPPLRERGEDILPLAKIFINEHAVLSRRGAPQLTVAADEYILRHPWPGNVRELRNCMRHMVATTQGGEVDSPALEAYLVSVAQGASLTSGSEGPHGRVTRERIVALLAKHGGMRDPVARELRIHRKTLWIHMKRLGIA